MVFPLIALSLLAPGIQDQDVVNPGIILKDAVTGQHTGAIVQISEPLVDVDAKHHIQRSPKMFGNTRWEFRWQTDAYESLLPGPKQLRFRVFSQERKAANDVAFSVARMLQRMWEYLHEDLGQDNSFYFGGCVPDVYLCKFGQPGGEQLMDNDQANYQGAGQKVNTIYFYDLDTFTDPVEMAREVAHEYGHASLGGASGYSDPEDWANGFLGEKLYLRHFDQAIKQHLLEPDDAMGVSPEKLDQWVKSNVDPLVLKAAQTGPNSAALKRRDKEGMDNFIGLALYVDTVFPESVFSLSMQRLPSENGEDYFSTIPMAVEEQKAFRLKMPSYLVGKQIWLPIGKSSLKGATVLDKRPNWVKITAQSTPIEVITPGPQQE